MLKLKIAKIICLFVPSKKLRRKIKKMMGINSSEFNNAFFELKHKRNSLFNGAKEIETLFIGSSHVAYGFNPKFFSSCSVNMGSHS